MILFPCSYFRTCTQVKSLYPKTQHHIILTMMLMRDHQSSVLLVTFVLCSTSCYLLMYNRLLKQCLKFPVVSMMSDISQLASFFPFHFVFFGKQTLEVAHLPQVCNINASYFFIFFGGNCKGSVLDFGFDALVWYLFSLKIFNKIQSTQKNIFKEGRCSVVGLLHSSVDRSIIFEYCHSNLYMIYY